MIKSKLVSASHYFLHQVAWLLGSSVFSFDNNEIEKLHRLYENAKRDQWNASQLFHHEITQDEILNLDEVEKDALSSLLSQFYYGERAAMIVSSQLVAMVDDIDAANFLTTQCVDEARHMEVFDKLASVAGGLKEINPFLRLLLADILRSPLIEKTIGMNLLIEGLALSSFHHMVKTWESHPKMKKNKLVIEPIEAIIRDESRHVGFGVLYLPKLAHNIGFIRRTRIKMRQMLWFALMYGSVKYHQQDTERLGLCFSDVLTKVINDHNERFKEMGLNVVVGGKKIESLFPFFDRIVNKIMS